MFVRIGVEDADADTQKRTALLAVATVCRKLKEEFRALQASWVASTSAASPALSSASA
jgi:hypothetical protein